MRVTYYQGDKLDEDTFIRDMAAFIVARLIGGVNVLFNGEILYNNKRLDHVGYIIPPLIIFSKPNKAPIIAIEDSSDVRRLKNRIFELEELSITKAYILVNYVNESDLIMNLRRDLSDNKSSNRFILEVGSGCWMFQR